MTKLEQDILAAKELIKNATSVLITAGAGMGVDSGLPDFRGTSGFWNAYPVIEKLGISFEGMANPKWFKENPSLAWAFYGHRLNLYRETKPHVGFRLLLDLVKVKKDNYFIFTSNVDGQFQKAGFDSKKIYEVHGSIHHFQCIDNCCNKITSADNEYIDVDMDIFEAKNIPLCDNCGEPLRPNILMFGDWGWNSDRTGKQAFRFNTFIKKNRLNNLVIIEIGAGLEIPTIQVEDDYMSKKYKNIKLIRINPRDSDVENGDNIGLPLNGLDGLIKVLT